jgi:stress-induced-phosphoprotein 1
VSQHTREIESQMQKCMTEMYAERSGETDEQTLERAMRDPEVAKIMVSGPRGIKAPSGVLTS